MSDWQPINSAPKDGTPVLLGRFTGDPKAYREGHCCVDWYRQIEKGDCYTGFGHFNSTYWPPTHWMHLPPAPEHEDG